MRVLCFLLLLFAFACNNPNETPEDNGKTKPKPKTNAQAASVVEPETTSAASSQAVASQPVEEEEPVLRWVVTEDEKTYLKDKPQKSDTQLIGLVRGKHPFPVYEEIEGDGCKSGTWLRVGPKSFPGYICSTKVKDSKPPKEEVANTKDPTAKNGLNYATTITDTYLYEKPDGSELAISRPKGSFVTVLGEKKVGGNAWLRVDGGWLKKSATRPSSARGSSTLVGEVLPPDAKLPWVFVVAPKANVYPNAGDTEGEIGTVERFDRFPVLEVTEVEVKTKKKGTEKVRWARIESGWVEGKKLDWVFQQERPEDIGPNEKWIFVDIEQQVLTAYEGDRPVYITLFSSGRAPNYTVTGRFTVHRMYRTHTMENAPGGDEESYYYVADIPFVTFFHKTFALHGTFWHNNFGATRSHGCVNMVPTDAGWIQSWIVPQIPKGWWGMALSEEDAKARGWTTVISKWGDRVVNAEDVMNSNAGKIVQQMREKKLKEAASQPTEEIPASGPIAE